MRNDLLFADSYGGRYRLIFSLLVCLFIRVFSVGKSIYRYVVSVYGFFR